VVITKLTAGILLAEMRGSRRFVKYRGPSRASPTAAQRLKELENELSSAG
jgi:hypothetical protein